MLSSKPSKKSMKNNKNQKRMVTGVLATSMVISAFAGSASAAPAVPASATSKIITDLDFTNTPGTPARIISDSISDFDFGTSIYASADIDIFDGVVTAYVTLNKNYSDMTELVDDFNTKLSSYNVNVKAVVVDANHFELQSKTIGPGNRFSLGSTDVSRQLITGDQVVIDGSLGTSKNKSFTISDGVDVATVTLTTSMNDMDDLVTAINSAMTTAQVNILASVKDGDEFTLTTDTTGQTAAISLGGANASDFFAQISYTGQDETATASVSSASTQPTSYYGETVYSTLTVSSGDPLVTAVPTGTFELSVDGSIPKAVSLVNGQAEFSTSDLGLGSHTFVFTYSGDTNYATSTSTKVLTTAKARTVSQLTLTPDTAKEGQSVTIKAVVPTIAPGDANPTGIVHFFDGAKEIGQKSLTTDLVYGNYATITLSNFTAGSHFITASYEGDSYHLSSNSSEQLLEVKAPTELEVVQSALDVVTVGYAPGDSASGASHNLTLQTGYLVGDHTVGVTWSSNNPSVIDAEGSLHQPAKGAGAAVVTLSANVYYGAASLTKEFQVTVPEESSQQAKDLTVTSSSGTSFYGEYVTFTAKVALQPDTPPTGTVNFSIDGGQSVPIPLNATGGAALTTSDLSAGNHTITASYSGDTNYNASNNSVTQVVNKVNTILSLVPINPVKVGDSVTFTVVVTPTPPTVTPIGTVNFYLGGSVIGSAPVDSQGMSTFTTTANTSGSFRVYAQYAGNENFNTSTSSQSTLSVSQDQQSQQPDPPTNNNGASGGSSGGSSSSGSSSNSGSATSTPKDTTTTPNPAPTPQPESKDVFKSEVIKADANVVEVVKAQIEHALKKDPAIQPADTKGHWAEKTLDTFVKLNVIQGYKDGTVKPNQEISRAEFVTILSRIFNVQGDRQVALRDVQGHWAQDAINKFVAAGVITGYGNGSFKPDNNITREEMVTILSRIVNFDAVSKDTTKGNFSDLNGSFASDAVKTAAQAGIINGNGDGQFEPKANSSRAEALQIILNALNLNPEIKMLLDTLN